MAAMIPECDIPECGPDPGRGEERRGLSAETHNGQSVVYLSWHRHSHVCATE